jgi:hypothetical protein
MLRVSLARQNSAQFFNTHRVHFDFIFLLAVFENDAPRADLRHLFHDQHWDDVVSTNTILADRRLFLWGLSVRFSHHAGLHLSLA